MTRVTKSAITWLSDRRLEPAWFFIALALVTGVSFLPYIGQLGFYLDDWPHVFFDKVGGPEANRLFHAYDGRPLSAWFYELTGNLIGYQPLAWQWFTLLTRFASTIILWLMWRIIWPRARWQTGAAALLFMVYPLFAQQAISVAFSVHWFSFLCFATSLYLMVLALTRRKWFWALTFVSLLLSGISLILVEYYVAVEALRIVWIWLLSARIKQTPISKAGWSLRHWSPYAVLLAAFVIWRMFLIQLPVADRNETILVTRLFEAPLDTILRVIQWSLQDFIQSSTAAWFKTLTPEMLDLGRPAYILSVLVVIFAAFISALYIQSARKSSIEEENGQYSWSKTALPAGVLITLAGPLPGWLIGRTLSSPSGMWNDRFGLAAMFGASLLLVAVIELLITRQKTRIVLLALLVGLAAGWQVRNANDYRWSWTYQKRFYDQLSWRIPYLEPGTLIVSEDELFSRVGIYPTSFALNLFFPVDYLDGKLSYYFMSLGKFYNEDANRFLKETEFYVKHWQAFFSGHNQKSITIDYRPEELHCLWVLGPEDALNPLISASTRTALQASDLSRIKNETRAGYPPEDVFGKPVEEGWCAYYQKAELAAQFGNWEEVVRLWEESRDTRRQMKAATELAPFIRGFLRTANFDQAVELTRQMNDAVGASEPYLCKLWQDETASLQPDPNAEAASNAMLKELQCHSLTPGTP